MKKTSFAHDHCPVARALEIVGDWWSLLIVRNAMTGTRRFTDFAEQLGLARNILSGRLKKLVAHEILAVVPASDGSAYKEYVLTEKGWGLFYVLVGLRQWTEEFFPAERASLDRLVVAKTREPVGPLKLHAQDGRCLGPSDVRLVMADGSSIDQVTMRRDLAEAAR